MATTNASIKIGVSDSTGLIVSGAVLTITMAGEIIRLITDSKGNAATGITITNITTARIVVEAKGLASQTIDTLVGITENNVYVTLQVGPNNLFKKVLIVDSNGLPVDEAVITIQGVISGSSGVDGYSYVHANAGPLSLKVTATGYTPISLSGTFDNTSFPSKFVLYPVTYSSQPVCIQTIPGAVVLLNNGTVFTGALCDADGFANIPIQLVPGPYSLSVVYEGYVSVDSTVVIKPGITYYSTGILEVDYGE